MGKREKEDKEESISSGRGSRNKFGSVEKTGFSKRARQSNARLSEEKNMNMILEMVAGGRWSLRMEAFETPLEPFFSVLSSRAIFVDMKEELITNEGVSKQKESQTK